jgi:uncharacterized protein YdhG (YjbR/CyaY superfamily)
MAGDAAEIDAYLAPLPEAHRVALEAVRRMIRRLAPEAVESFGYGIPAFSYKGRPLIYFGAAKKHCALYGTAEERVRDLLAARTAQIDTSPARRPTRQAGPRASP